MKLLEESFSVQKFIHKNISQLMLFEVFAQLSLIETFAITVFVYICCQVRMGSLKYYCCELASYVNEIVQRCSCVI